MGARSTSLILNPVPIRVGHDRWMYVLSGLKTLLEIGKPLAS